MNNRFKFWKSCLAVSINLWFGLSGLAALPYCIQNGDADVTGAAEQCGEVSLEPDMNDSLLLAALVKNVILVHRVGETDSDALVRTGKILIEQCGANIIGVVLNNIKFKVEYSSAHYHYYQYEALPST